MKVGGKFRIKKKIKISIDRFVNYGKIGLCEITQLIGNIIEYKNEDGEISYMGKDKLNCYIKNKSIILK